MSGKHAADDAQCDAICKGALVDSWGFIAGSRCTHPKGHSTPRNGVGHYFPKKLAGGRERSWRAPVKGGYQGIVTDRTTPVEKRVPPKSPASSAGPKRS